MFLFSKVCICIERERRKGKVITRTRRRTPPPTMHPADVKCSPREESCENRYYELGLG
jgi:hypothetical protein